MLPHVFSRTGKCGRSNEQCADEDQGYEGTDNQSRAAFAGATLTGVQFSGQRNEDGVLPRRVASPANLYVYDFATKKPLLTESLNPEINANDLWMPCGPLQVFRGTIQRFFTGRMAQCAEEDAGDRVTADPVASECPQRRGPVPREPRLCRTDEQPRSSATARPSTRPTTRSMARAALGLCRSEEIFAVLTGTARRSPSWAVRMAVTWCSPRRLQARGIQCRRRYLRRLKLGPDVILPYWESQRKSLRRDR